MATFGENLKRERLLRGISLREVAEATKISVRFLEAIENGRLDVLPGGLFLRSFIRQYAAHLGLDAERVVADFLCEFGEKVEPPPAAPRPRRLSLLRGAAWFLPLGLLLSLGVVRHMMARRSRPEPVLVAPPSQATPQGLPTDRVFPPPASASPLPAGGDLALALRARESCWVAVEADGVKVLEGVLNAGETRKLRAKGELVLSVGNAGGVEVSVNGGAGVPLGRPGEVRRRIQITHESLPSLLQENPDATPHG